MENRDEAKQMSEEQKAEKDRVKQEQKAEEEEDFKLLQQQKSDYQKDLFSFEKNFYSSTQTTAELAADFAHAYSEMDIPFSEHNAIKLYIGRTQRLLNVKFLFYTVTPVDEENQYSFVFQVPRV